MAELTNEAVERLNKLLDKLSRAQAAESPAAGGGGAAPRGRARDYDADREALEELNQAEEMAELAARRRHADALGRDDEVKKLNEDMERLRDDMDAADKRRRAGELKRKIRANEATQEEIAQLKVLEDALDEIADATDAPAPKPARHG